ncbi:MAG: aryl-sulfate sulfotransferase [Candidatus Omnitrophica bacterium]|nr:aryl-sulfate sulfotransferase [Candidatus Omnitrophota bacterium]
MEYFRKNIIRITLGLFFCLSALEAPAQQFGGRGSIVFERDDRNKDGKISRGEFRGPRHVFNVLDTDNDGFINEVEDKTYKGEPIEQPVQENPPQPEDKRGGLVVDIWKKDKTYNSTTLFAHTFDEKNPKIVEIDMEGNVVWEYKLPSYMKKYAGPMGVDVELLENDNILLLLPKKGIYEINRKGRIVWSYYDPKVSHDADRLEDGSTLVVWGLDDDINDIHVKEVTKKGKIIWSWSASDYPESLPEYDQRYCQQGWTHTNAATRLKNGNTLVSLRNFQYLAEIDPNGEVVKTIGKGIFSYPHDPEILPNGNILAASQYPLLSTEPKNKDINTTVYTAAEIDPQTNEIIWNYNSYEWTKTQDSTFDANRLPNGNTLIVGGTSMIEVTPEGEIVWRLKPEKLSGVRLSMARQFLYKAQRLEKLD